MLGGVCVLVLGCHGVLDDDAARRQCEDVTAQIEEAFLDYTQSGNMLPGQEPCQLTVDSFVERVSPENVDTVLGQFANACDIQADACSGHYREPPRDSEPPQSVSGPPSEPPPHIQSERATSR